MILERGRRGHGEAPTIMMFGASWCAGAATRWCWRRCPAAGRTVRSPSRSRVSAGSRSGRCLQRSCLTHVSVSCRYVTRATAQLPVALDQSLPPVTARLARAGDDSGVCALACSCSAPPFELGRSGGVRVAGSLSLGPVTRLRADDCGCGVAGVDGGGAAGCCTRHSGPFPRPEDTRTPQVSTTGRPGLGEPARW